MKFRICHQKQFISKLLSMLSFRQNFLQTQSRHGQYKNKILEQWGIPFLEGDFHSSILFQSVVETRD